MAPAADAPDLPPFDAAAEASVVGCALLLPEESLPLIVERNAQDDCYELRHRTILEMLIDMSEANDSIDTVTVAKALRSRHQLQGIGGIEYLTQLQDTVPSQAHLPAWLDIVQEKALLRKMIQVGSNIALAATDAGGDPEAILDAAETQVLAIRQQRTVTGAKLFKQLVIGAINEIEAMHARKGEMTGLATGFLDLDKMTGGFNGGELVILAGRPSSGKSSLAMNIADYVIVNLSQPVGVFSLEMTAESLALRMVCSRAHVNLKNVREGFLAERDFPTLTNSAAALIKGPLHIDDRGSLTILQLRAAARRMHQQHGIKLLIVDYLQLLSSAGRRDNRQQEVTDISCGLKALAKELNIPIIALCQLNRSLDKDKQRRPRLSDLRESGSIEQDADFVGMLYQDQTDEEPEVRDDADIGTPMNLLIAKQRSGPTGIVHLTFLKAYTRFESAAKFTQDEERFGN